MQRGARGEGATAEPAAAEAAAAAMVWCGGARRDARAAGVGGRAARTATAARGRARHLREQQLRQPACRRTTPRARRRCPPTRANSPAAPTAPWLLTHGAVSTMATAAGAHELPAARRRVRVVARDVLPVRAVQQVLGEIDANLNQADSFGRTPPLQTAVCSADERAAAILLEAATDMRARRRTPEADRARRVSGIARRRAGAAGCWRRHQRALGRLGAGPRARGRDCRRRRRGRATRPRSRSSRRAPSPTSPPPSAAPRRTVRGGGGSGGGGGGGGVGRRRAWYSAAGWLAGGGDCGGGQQQVGARLMGASP